VTRPGKVHEVIQSDRVPASLANSIKEFEETKSTFDDTKKRIQPKKKEIRAKNTERREQIQKKIHKNPGAAQQV
jgi:septal ring factor EnvC (AmiA/AmiB activator)